MQQHAMLEMQADRSGQRHAFDIASHPCQLGDAVRMIDAGNLLLDDRRSSS
jgi:hypothetical protein